MRQGSWRRRQAIVHTCATTMALLSGAALASSDCALEPGPSRAVVRILDSETLALDDGSEVRLIGALGPRSPDSAGDVSYWPPEQDAVQGLTRLALGQSVELRFSGRRMDRHGRLLAHAFVVTGAARTWIQGHMLSHGFARAYALPESVACLDELLAHESAARTKRTGLWTHAAYQVLSAVAAPDLMRYRGTYQIVEGRVAQVATVRGQVFVNFGRDWREDFTATLRSSARRAAEATGMDLKSLEGRRVRVRGWIERRSGPAIEIHHPGQIEIVAEDEPPPRRRPLPRIPRRDDSDGASQPPPTKKRPAGGPPGVIEM